MRLLEPFTRNVPSTSVAAHRGKTEQTQVNNRYDIDSNDLALTVLL